MSDANNTAENTDVQYLTGTSASVRAKLADMTVPGFVAEFTPEEAELAGAFTEDALSLRDAYDSASDAEEL